MRNHPMKKELFFFCVISSYFMLLFYAIRHFFNALCPSFWVFCN